VSTTNLFLYYMNITATDICDIAKNAFGKCVHHDSLPYANLHMLRYYKTVMTR